MKCNYGRGCVTGSKSIYMCNASSIYVLTVTEVFMQFQLDDGLTLRYSARLLWLCWNK